MRVTRRQMLALLPAAALALAAGIYVLEGVLGRTQTSQTGTPTATSYSQPIPTTTASTQTTQGSGGLNSNCTQQWGMWFCYGNVGDAISKTDELKNQVHPYFFSTKDNSLFIRYIFRLNGIDLEEVKDQNVLQSLENVIGGDWKLYRVYLYLDDGNGNIYEYGEEMYTISGNIMPKIDKQQNKEYQLEDIANLFNYYKNVIGIDPHILIITPQFSIGNGKIYGGDVLYLYYPIRPDIFGDKYSDTNIPGFLQFMKNIYFYAGDTYGEILLLTSSLNISRQELPPMYNTAKYQELQSKLEQRGIQNPAIFQEVAKDNNNNIIKEAYFFVPEELILPVDYAYMALTLALKLISNRYAAFATLHG